MVRELVSQATDLLNRFPSGNDLTDNAEASMAVSPPEVPGTDVSVPASHVDDTVQHPGHSPDDADIVDPNSDTNDATAASETVNI